MMNFWEAPKFDDLYRNFITGSNGGKIFIMKRLEKGDTILGKGAVILLQKATPFLLAILKEHYMLDRDMMIGDVEMLLQLVEKQRIRDIKKSNHKRIHRCIKVPKTKMQIHNILRQQNSVKPIKIKLNIKKKEER